MTMWQCGGPWRLGSDRTQTIAAPVWCPSEPKGAFTDETRAPFRYEAERQALVVVMPPGKGERTPAPDLAVEF